MLQIFDEIDCKAEDMYENIRSLLFARKLLPCPLQSACVQHSRGYTGPV